MITHDPKQRKKVCPNCDEYLDYHHDLSGQSRETERVIYWHECPTCDYTLEDQNA